MDGGLKFVEEGCFTALGPTDNLWSSPCFPDLSQAVIKSFFNAESKMKYQEIFMLRNFYYF